MTNRNNISRIMSPALWGVTIILIILLIALSYILFLLSRTQPSSSQPVIDPAIAGEGDETVAILPTELPPTNTPQPLPTATELPTSTPNPTDTPIPTSEPTPTEIIESLESSDAISETVDVDIEGGETVTDTVTLDEEEAVEEAGEEEIGAEEGAEAEEAGVEGDGEALADTAEITSTTAITGTELLTETVSAPVLTCEAGPLEADDGCIYNVSIGLSVQTGGIHDWYLSNTGTCGIPANHKMVEASNSGLVTVEQLTEYVIGGEYFPEGHTVAPDVDISVNEPPFIFLNFIVPEEAGTYESCWRLTDENNNPYGEPLITTITVEETAEEESEAGDG